MVESMATNGRKVARRRGSEPKPVAPDPPASPPSDDPCPVLQKQLADQLVILRAEFQEAVASYSVRVQGLLALVGDLLVDEPVKLGDAEQKRRARLLRQALRDVGNLDLKPAKGRRRDLKAAEQFATALCDEIAEW